MVGLVVVSHSRALARAAVALAEQMLPTQPVPIEISAGLDETTFGTDAVAVAAAITAADHGDGVVVLADLGSAVLSAELALEFLPDDVRDRVVRTAAPLVEGLVVAAVTAASGADRWAVAAEATAALTAKQAQTGTPVAPTVEEPPSPAPPQPSATDDRGSAAAATLRVNSRHGLHARPVARLVHLVRSLRANVEVRNRSTGSPWVPAASLSRVATLGALPGHDLEVRATGPQAHEAVTQLAALAARGFDEVPHDTGPQQLPPSAEPAEASPFHPGLISTGEPASPGIAIGPAAPWSSIAPQIPDLPSQGTDIEWARIRDAVAAVERDLHRLRSVTADPDRAAIIDAHLLLLDDPELLGRLRNHIDAGGAAPQAWSAVTDRLIAEFEALADPYLAARAADVAAVAGQVTRALAGTAAPAPPAAGVLIAPDLTPLEAASLDPRVTGILLAFGSATAHTAIIARTRGMPAVVGLGPTILAVPAGVQVVLDGTTGEVVVAPPETTLAAARQRLADQRARRDRSAARASTAAVTRDGVSVVVGANIGSVEQARAAVRGGADLAGLVRTELLFLDRDRAPTADEQEGVYRQIANVFAGRRVTLRTLDVGGDKPLRYLPFPTEANPFLGVRGLRFGLAHPDLFTEQLIAIVRVARNAPVDILFPMVSTVDEVIRARRLLDRAIARAGGPVPVGLRVGIMVEVPAAAVKVATFQPYVDFVSIGTNDLTQYALAAERGNPALAALSDGLDPGVLRLIDAVCRGGLPVTVCGELAADLTAVPLLVGLGVRELSVAPPAVAGVKEAVRAADLAEMAQTARQALELRDAAAVRALLGSRGHPDRLDSGASSR